jgi:hypothetical protein
MKWYLLKTFGGNWTGWHNCEFCFDEWRIKTVAAAMQSNQHMDEPERMIDPGRWHEATMEDLAGTTVWELSCYGCGEYEPNEDVLREDVELPEPADIFAEPAPMPAQERLKYFSNMAPMDPEAKPKDKKKATVPKFKYEYDQINAVMQAEMARMNGHGPDF